MGMAVEIDPRDTDRAAAFALWMNAPNPMVTLIKTVDVTHLVRVGKRRRLKFNLLLDYCVGKAASGVKEFYTLPVDGRLLRYDALAVNTIVRNRSGGINSCDVLYTPELDTFGREYLRETARAAEESRDRDLSSDCMVIGTSALVETELDGAVGMYSGIYNNPFLIWGKYRRRLLRCELPISFQFHHTQMDGAHAAAFLNNLQTAVNELD